MNSVYIQYNGWPGDDYYFEPSKLASRYAPSAQPLKAQCFSWLSQKGFGPGYFNNSGKYALFQKLNFKGEIPAEELAALKNKFCMVVFESKEAFDEAKTRLKDHEKHMRKRNPY